MHNTPNGLYPGHVRAGEHPRPADPVASEAQTGALAEKKAPSVNNAQKPSPVQSASQTAADAIAPGLGANVELSVE